MTITDQATATDAPCRCGCPKWDHKQGRAVCKQCGCETYEPARDAVLAKLRAENERLHQAATVLAADLEAARAEAKQVTNELAEVRGELGIVQAQRDAHRSVANVALADLAKAREQLADLEAALVEANAARRLSNTEHVHQRLSAAALVIGRLADWRYCPLCRDLTEVKGARHVCGPLAPVDVIVIRRPKTTEETP